MKLLFFDKASKAKMPERPTIYLNESGSAILSGGATALLNPKLGAAATFCFDEDRQQWLLALWQDGEPGRPKLRKVNGDKKRVRFNDKQAVSALFKHLGISLHYLSVKIEPDAEVGAADKRMQLFRVIAQLYSTK